MRLGWYGPGKGMQRKSSDSDSDDALGGGGGWSLGRSKSWINSFWGGDDFLGGKPGRERFLMTSDLREMGREAPCSLK